MRWRIRSCREEPSDPTQSHGRTVYFDYVAEQIKREDERKASFESRAVAVVTTSGVLVTLLLGLATLAKRVEKQLVLPDASRQEQFVLPEASHQWVKWALIFFIAAAVFALLVNIPFKYQFPLVTGLQKLVDCWWDDSFEAAQKRVTENRLSVLRAAQRLNHLKGYLLFGAVLFEVMAVGLVARAVWVAL